MIEILKSTIHVKSKPALEHLSKKYTFYPIVSIYKVVRFQRY